MSATRYVLERVGREGPQVQGVSNKVQVLKRVSREDPQVQGVSNKICTGEGW